MSWKSAVCVSDAVKCSSAAMIATETASAVTELESMMASVGIGETAPKRRVAGAQDRWITRGPSATVSLDAAQRLLD